MTKGTGKPPAADERIEEHRTTNLNVLVSDDDGGSTEVARVEISMQRHKFRFGTAVSAGHRVEEPESGDEYRTHLTGLFNEADSENRHTWDQRKWL